MENRRRRIVRSWDFEQPILLIEDAVLDPSNGGSRFVLRKSMVANQLLVSSQEPLIKEDLDELLEGSDWSLMRISRNGLLATLQSGELALDTIEKGMKLFDSSLRKTVEISVGPNLIIYASITEPNDASYESLWWLDSSENFDIDAPEGWDRLTDASEVVVAIIDSGIRMDHDDLSSNIWTNSGEISGNGKDDDQNGYVDDVRGINTITDTSDPTDDNGHGKHVAGIVGAVGNNGVGISGVAWKAKLMSVKALNASGRGVLEDVIEAIDYAVDNGAKIINASWSGEGFAPSLDEALKRALNKQVLVVAAAGNEGIDIGSSYIHPASSKLANVVTVASSNRDGNLSSFSNYGPDTVDLIAPGEDILSTWYDSKTSYSLQDGTSMAASIVSGILALNISLRPNDSLQTHIDRIGQSSKKRSSLYQYSKNGGIVNLASSLEMETVPYPPKIESHSSTGMVKKEGESLEMSVTVSSKSAAAFAWYFNDVLIDGESSALFSLESIIQAQAGTYRFVATNADGETRVDFLLSIIASNDDLVEGLDGDESLVVFTKENSPWQLASDPQSREGDHIQVMSPEDKYGEVELDAIVRGPGELRFLWRIVDGSDYSPKAICSIGEKTEYLSHFRLDGKWEVARFDLPEDKDYEVHWSWKSKDERGKGSKLVIDYLKVFPEGQVPPLIFYHPSSPVVQPFSDFTFYVGAAGENLSYEWYKDGVKLDVSDERRLSLRDVVTEDEGRYHAVVSNEHGSETSHGGVLEIDESQTPVRFIERSALFGGSIGESLEVTLEHVGSPPITYRWLKNRFEIPGEKGPILSFDELRMEDADDYTLIIENPYGSAQWSDSIRVGVSDVELSPGAVLYDQKMDQIKLLEGGVLEFDYYLEHELESWKYQWYHNGLPVEGQTGLFLHIEDLRNEDSGIYAIEIRNSLGSFRDEVLKVAIDIGIGDALDLEAHEWHRNSDADYGWNFQQYDISYDGEDAVEFSRLYDFYGYSYYDNGGFTSAVGTKVTGPTNLSAYWKRSSKRSRFEVFVGSQKGVFGDADLVSILDDSSGAVEEWHRSVVHIPEGEHYVHWNFVGADPDEKGWLDNVKKTNFPAIVGIVPKTVLVDSDSGSIEVEAWGDGEISYQWFRNGQPIRDANRNKLLVDARFMDSDDEYKLVVTSPFGQVQTSNIGFLSIDQVFDFGERRVEFKGDSKWELAQEPGVGGVAILSKPGEYGTLGILIEGPAIVSFDSFNGSVFVDKEIVEVSEWTEAYGHRNSYVRMPEGEHLLRFYVGGGIYSEIPKKGGLRNLQIGTPFLLDVNREDVGDLEIEGYIHRLVAHVAADLPAVATWYKRGGEKIREATFSSMYSSHLACFSANEDYSRSEDVGTYYCEVVDVHGAKVRSKDFVVTDWDVTAFGEIVGDNAFEYRYDRHNYTKLEYDTEVHMEGNASVYANIPDAVDSAGFHLSISGGQGDRYPAAEFFVRLAGYDGETIVDVYDGVGSVRQLELNDEWQRVYFEGNSSNIYFYVTKSPGSKLDLWVDGMRSISDLRVTNQPKHYATYLNGKASFSVEGFSSVPIFYQWRFEGEPIEGGSGRTLDIGAVGLEHIGSYDVVLSSGGQHVVSEGADLSRVEDLGSAIGMPGVKVTTWGDSLWRVDRSVSLDGAKSLISGEVGIDGFSSLRFEFESPGSVSLYQKFEFEEGNETPWETRRWTDGSQPLAIDFTLERNRWDSGQNQETALRLDRMSFSPFGLKTYEQWLRNGTLPALDLGTLKTLGDRFADPDGDGIQNYLEYFFDLDPLERSELPSFEFIHSENNTIASLDYRYVANREYSIQFEMSENLAEWFKVYPSVSRGDISESLYYNVNALFEFQSEETRFIRWSIRGDSSSSVELQSE